MILLKVTNDQLLAIGQDANFAPLVSALVTIQSANSARGLKPQNKEGYIEVGEKFLSLPTIVGLAQFGVEFKPINCYVEVDTANLGISVPSYLPNATSTEMIDDVPTEVQNTWEDLKSRTSLDGTKNICSLNKNLTIDQISQALAETDFTLLNHPDTLARIAADYNEPE